MSKSQHYIDYFLSHRKVTNTLIGKMEKENYDYKPTPTSMSAQELALHMLQSFYQFTATAAKQTPEVLHQQGEAVDLVELAETYTNKTVKLLQSLSDQDFEEIIDLTDILGAKLPAAQVIDMAIDHEINHKGNLFVYVREMGHTDLPMFVAKG
ncbi:DinB family protein [Aquibacillus sediminis]|uniref:DinB family protein n=1 Tax=Aquibacillus sediminis TaxID=2574734 RepID=UPI001107B8C2|nr:DinB family protein [Aquibacillus sediminis]